MTIHQSSGGESVESGDIVQRFREHEADDCAEWARDEQERSSLLPSNPVEWYVIAVVAAAVLAMLMSGSRVL